MHLRLPSSPGRPPKPQLVAPRSMPSPKTSGLPAAAFMLHNLAHVELNAVDLAWDTVARFSHLGLPDQFYRDFARCEVLGLEHGDADFLCTEGGSGIGRKEGGECLCMCVSGGWEGEWGCVGTWQA